MKEVSRPDEVKEAGTRIRQGVPSHGTQGVSTSHHNGIPTHIGIVRLVAAHWTDSAFHRPLKVSTIRQVPQKCISVAVNLAIFLHFGVLWRLRLALRWFVVVGSSPCGHVEVEVQIASHEKQGRKNLCDARVL